MATKKKMLQAAAGNAGGEALNVEDVFSTYLYEGNGSTQTITNGIDLDGEGGLVWIKRRDSSAFHILADTERGATNFLKTSSTDASGSLPELIKSFNSDGFSVGSGYGVINASGGNDASWTFRKAPKFFDVVTYTGDGVAGRTVSHNLGTTVGCIIVKRTDTTGNWHTYHRGIDVNGDSAPETDQIYLNLTNAASDGLGYWNDTAPTSTEFTVGTNSGVNASGATYVAYLFAHNDGDGEFGPDGDADIIKCGSYTGNGSTNGPEIDLGFEPQWLLIKNASGTGVWWMLDVMRGLVVGGDDAILTAQGSGAEYAQNVVSPTPTGFNITSSAGQINTSGNDYIYIAIRRGTKVPESATDVAHVGQQSTGTGSATSLSLNTGFPVDFLLSTVHVSGYTTTRHAIVDRLRGFNGTLSKRLITHSTDAEANAGTTLTGVNGDSNSGIYNAGNVSSAYSANTSLALKRAPNFFDVVTWEGDGTTDKVVNHNLTVPPEMIWFKNRDGVESWYVPFYGVSGISDGHAGLLNGTNTIGGRNMSTQSPTSDTVYFGGAFGIGNTSGDSYIAYLFASLDGVSKIGTYTGNGSSQTIDCGFSSGARFVLIKRTDSTGDWVEFDTNKGIVTGNDPFVILNSNADKSGVSADHIDPDNSGFIVNQDAETNINVSSASYIFYAIA